MKNLLCLWSLLSISGWCGLTMPTSYECKGNNVRVFVISNHDETYSMMIEMGDQTFTDLTVIPEETMIGELFSVNVFHAPDFMSEHLVVLLPTINLLKSDSVEFMSGMMRVITRTSFAGPAMVDGPLEQYVENQRLSCTAFGAARQGS